MNSNVFITDGHWRKSLAAVRALGRQGLRVTVGETTRLATAAFSRYCWRSAVYPSPLLNPGAFVDFFRNRLSHRSYQMLLPMEDETTSIFSQYRSDLTSMTYLPVPYFETFKRARHKDRTLKLAEQIGIPIPKTWYVEDLSQIAKLKDHLPYPVVIKPKIGSGAIGIHYPKNPREFVDRYTRVHRISPYPLIQDRIPVNGISYGASFLMDENGRVKASFVHRRIREYPVSGGASTLRESIRHDDIRDMGLSLLKALDWSGVAMVEFKVDPRDNTPKLMEINPRFWGSLALAVDAGVNFPYLMYRLSLGENFRPVEHYQIGKRCRWLLPGDILHFIRNPQRRKLMPHFFRFGDANTTYDILSLGDPLPSLARILTPLTFLYNKDMKQRLRKRKK